MSINHTPATHPIARSRLPIAGGRSRVVVVVVDGAEEGGKAGTVMVLKAPVEKAGGG